MLIMAKAESNSPKMSNFEDVFSKTRNVAETINKKGSLYLELSRKKIEYMDAKSKLAKAYQHFGKLQFSAYLGEEVDENEYAVCVADITAYRERIDVLKAELDDAKNKDAQEFVRGAEEFKEEVKSASKEARDAILIQAREFFRAFQNAVNSNNKNTVQRSDDKEHIEVEFTEAENTAKVPSDENVSKPKSEE